MQKIKLMAKALITSTLVFVLLYSYSFNSIATVEEDEGLQKTISPGETTTYNFTVTNDNPTSGYEDVKVEVGETPKNWTAEVNEESFRLYYGESKKVVLTVKSPKNAENKSFAQIIVSFTESPLIGSETKTDKITNTTIYVKETSPFLNDEASKKSESTDNTILYGILAGFGIFVVCAIAIYYLNKKNYLSLKNQNTVAIFVILVVVIVVIAGTVIFLFGGNKPTEKAPDFSLKDTDGKEITLKGFRGNVVLLDFMSISCKPCEKSIPILKDLKNKYNGLVIISIEVNSYTYTDDDLRNYKEKHSSNWYHALDTDSVATKYNIKYTPTFVIVNKDGYITYLAEGEKSFSELSDAIDNTISGNLAFITIKTMGIYTIAFIAGISAFFSPCAFPLLPAYMSYYLGRGQTTQTNYLTEQEKKLQRKKTLRKAIIGGVVASLGIIVIYLLIGAIISLFGGGVTQYLQYIAPIVAIIIAILGVMMLTGHDVIFSKITIALYPITNALKKPFGSLGSKVDEKEYTGLFAYGVGYGSASLGCHAPIFIAVIAMALISGGFFSAFGAFIAYGIGMGMLMIIVTVLIGMAKGEIVGKLKNLMPLIKKGSAIVLIIVGVYMTWYYLSTLSI